MDVRQLRYFVAIVECGSLAKASRQLFIAQPALSQQLAKLEGEVGKQLLSRSFRGVTPTENGSALYHHARFLLRQLDQALSVARQETGEIRGVVTVGLPSTTAAAIGIPLLKRVRKRFPGVLLNVVEGMSGHLEQMMRMDQLDMAFLFRGDVSPDLDNLLLLEEELVVLLPCDSTLVAGDHETIALAEVAALPLVLPTRSHGLRQRVMAEFERRGLDPWVVAEVDSLSMVLGAVRAGIGATIKPMSALQLPGDVHCPLRPVRIGDASIMRRNYLYSIDAPRLSSAAVAVMAELQDTARLEVASGRWKGVNYLAEGAGVEQA